MVTQPSAAAITASQVLARLAGRLLPTTWVLAGSESEHYLTVMELVARKGFSAIDRANLDVLGLADATEAIKATDRLIHTCNALGAGLRATQP